MLTEIVEGLECGQSSIAPLRASCPPGGIDWKQMYPSILLFSTSTSISASLVRTCLLIRLFIGHELRRGSLQLFANVNVFLRNHEDNVFSVRGCSLEAIPRSQDVQLIIKQPYLFPHILHRHPLHLGCIRGTHIKNVSRSPYSSFPDFVRDANHGRSLLDQRAKILEL